MTNINDQISAFQAALPQRPLKIKSEWHFYIPPIALILLLFMLYSGGNLFNATKSLLTQWGLSDELSPITIPVDTKCSYLPSEKSSRLKRNPFGYRCHFSAIINQHDWEETLYSSQLFAEEIKNISLLQDQLSPDRYTTNVAQNRLNQQIVFIAQSLLFLLIALYILIRIGRAAYRDLTNRGIRYDVGAIPIHLSRSTFIRYQIINYQWNDRTYKTTFPLNDSPIIVSREGETITALALIDPTEQSPPHIIDQRLKRISLTKEERLRVLKSLNKR